MKLYYKIITPAIGVFVFFCANNLFAQTVSVGMDKMNVVYIGVPNPMTVAMENCPCKDMIVKTSNGKLEGSGCYYVLKPANVGKTTITISNRKNKRGSITVYEFRTKMVPSPIFKIGPYGTKGWKAVIAAQQYVRAELENFDFDARFNIDSFHVTIASDSVSTKEYFNISSKISDELHIAFTQLHIGDVIIFDRIYAKGPDNLSRELTPLELTIIK